MKNQQKGFTSLVLIVLLVVIVAGGYFTWSKKSKEVKNTSETLPLVIVDDQNIPLKTYTNTQYGFELSYPEGYFLTENKTGISVDSSESCKTMRMTASGEWPKDCFTYSLLIQKNKILAEWSGNVKNAKQIGGYSAEKFEINDGMWDSLSQIYFQFEKDGNWYITHMSFNSENKIIAESILNQILSTFKFTPIISSAEVSLDMTNQYAKTYKTLFTAEFAKPANLDGHFRVVAVGCGTNCAYLYALDKNNGKVYQVSFESVGDFEILSNQIRATVGGNKVIYIFNPAREDFSLLADIY